MTDPSAEAPIPAASTQSDHQAPRNMPTPWYFQARGRTALAVAMGAAALLVGPNPLALRLFVAWDVYAFVQVALILRLVTRASVKATKARCVVEDPGRRGVFFLTVLSTLTSLAAAVGALRRTKELAPNAPMALEVAAVLAVAGGWILVHSTYALRYARLYYGRHATPQGLEFPGTCEPDDLDFLYFAVTIGMTFQTADVAISGKAIRRTVLAHALHAFLYNTVIVVVAINFVLGNM